MQEITGETKVESITFVDNESCSYTTTTVSELIKEINHYQAFWLSSVGHEYTNSVPSSKKSPKVVIKVKNLTPEIRSYISNRMRG